MRVVYKNEAVTAVEGEHVLLRLITPYSNEPVWYRFVDNGWELEDGLSTTAEKQYQELLAKEQDE